MKTRWWVMGFAMAAVPAFAWAQSAGRLTRVAPEAKTDQDASDFDRAEWKKKISARDLSQREEAFDRLAEIARKDPAAREALESWSEEEGSELAWTSRLILREASRGSRHGMGAFGHGFDFDGFARRFDDLDSMFGDLRTEWDSLLDDLPHPSGNGQMFQFDGSKSMTLQSGPDGVTVKITEDVDGKETTREYQAKTMEELLEANPELRSSLGGSGTHVWSFPRGQGFPWRTPSGLGGHGGSGVHVMPPTTPRSGELFQAKPGEIPTDRLGIYCDELEEGEGLSVLRTEPGSIASVLGLREGDVVVEMNGTAIKLREDVQKVLTDREEGAELSVVVVGSEGRRTLTWKPSAKKNEKAEPRSGSRKL